MQRLGDGVFYENTMFCDKIFENCMHRSVAYDFLMKFPGYFKVTSARQWNRLTIFPVDLDGWRQRGGVAPNIAYTLALLGENSVFARRRRFRDYRHGSKVTVLTRACRVIPQFTAFSLWTRPFQCTDRQFLHGAMADAREHAIAALNDEKPIWCGLSQCTGCDAALCRRMPPLASLTCTIPACS